MMATGRPEVVYKSVVDWKEKVGQVSKPALL